MKPNAVFFILPLAMLSMIVGVYAGWLRLGWNFPLIEPQSVPQHGALMVGSFLGTLIATEKVSTAQSKWWWLVPVIFISSFPLMMHVSAKSGYMALVLGSLGYVWLCGQVCLTYRFTSDILLFIGAIFQFLGHFALLRTFSFPMAFAGWLAFFVFTIVGERLNLTRFLPVSKRDRTELFIWLGLFIASLFLYHKGYGFVLTLVFVGIAQWLIRNDIARKNLSKEGLHRFLGATLLIGYGWLILTGFVALFNGSSTNATWIYDAVVHSFFIGFILTMIMAHAPIIFPSLLGINVRPYHPVMYVFVIP